VGAADSAATPVGPGILVDHFKVVRLAGRGDSQGPTLRSGLRPAGSGLLSSSSSDEQREVDLRRLLLKTPVRRSSSRPSATSSPLVTRMEGSRSSPDRDKQASAAAK